jgi:hypothetical protein
LKSFAFPAFSADEIREKINGITGFRPTLGFIFTSPELDIPACAGAIASCDFPVFGCSAGGQILPVAGEPPVLDGSAVCLFLDLDPALFSVSRFFRDTESQEGFGQRIGAWGMSLFTRPAFIIAIAGLKNNGEAIVHGIESACPPKTPVFGGIASDDGTFCDTSVFTGSGYSTDGAVVIVFDGSRVEVDGIAASGWTGIGTDMVVTSSEGNVLKTINNQPALQLFRDYLDIRDEKIQQVGLTFPLLLKRADGSEVLRTFLSVDFDAGSLTFAGSVPQGSRVQFSSSFGYEIIEKSIRHLDDYHSRHPSADLVLTFSCTARHQVAGPMVNDEITAALGLWNAPLIGFFTYGEIGYNQYGTCDFYNETLSLVTLRLKP